MGAFLKSRSLRGHGHLWLVPILLGPSALFAVSVPNGLASDAEIVPPEQCVVQPLSESDLLRFAASPAANTTVPNVGPDGEEADQATVEAISATIRRSIACANANDPMRAFALFTPRYLHERFSGEGQDDLGHLIAALSRDPAVATSEDQLALVSVADARVLPDTRVAAVVTTGNTDILFVDEVILVWQDDRWLIDQVVLGSATGIGTPVP